MEEIISAIINSAGVIIAAIISVTDKRKKGNSPKLTINQFLLILIFIISLFNTYCILSDYRTTKPDPLAPSKRETIEAITSTESAQSIETAINYPQITPGKTIELGKYEQDNNEVNGAEAIKWIVLEQEQDHVLLISFLGLDSHPYDQSDQYSDWSNSSLRAWLNGEFYSTAFSEDEKESILNKEISQHKNNDYPYTDQGEATIDHVFLLSSQEYLTYVHGNGNIHQQDRYGKPSVAAKQNYTAEKKLDLSDNKYCWWWLRTSGKDLESACCVTAYGELNPGQKDINALGGLVRPAIWVNVSLIEES